MDLLSLFSFNKDEHSPKPSAPPKAYLDLIERIGDMRTVQAKDVMTSRALVEAIDMDVELERLHIWKTTALYSPVYKDDLDNILGWISPETLKRLAHDDYTGSLVRH